VNLTPAQKEIARDSHRFRVLNCGRRFGKTLLAVEEMVGKAMAKKGRRIAYFAPTRDDAREITWGMLVSKCENIITYKNEQRLEVKIMTIDGGESSITLYGWEAVKDRGKGRGLANDFIVLDEVAFYRGFWEGWNEVLSPTLIDRKGEALFISTPKGFNHFYDLYNMQENNSDYKSFHFTSYDNPHIPVEEIAREKASKPENAFAQEYLADFRKAEGLVYKEFNRERHTYEVADIRVNRILSGIDFGFTNPTAVLTVIQDFDNHFWITSEWYKREKTNVEIIDWCKSIRAEKYYPDPAEPDRIEEMKRAGLNVQEVSKDVEKGIDSVRELFKTNRIHIHNSCQNLIAELETYRYKEHSGEGNNPEEPVKENDHALDALRYVLFNQRPIDNSRQEDFNLYKVSYS
jgi:PBSX family phage terminase large subunit